MRRLLIWSTAMTLVCGLLVTAARAIGGSVKSSKPTVVEMLEADLYLGRHRWCWRDICPGQTTLVLAVNILKREDLNLVGGNEPDKMGGTYTFRSASQQFERVTLVVD